MQPEVEPEPAPLRPDREPADDRDPGVVVEVADDPHLTDGCLSAPDGGDQHEARLVDKDNVGTQPHSVLFARGQSLRFQCSIRSSSRSRARRSGFWRSIGSAEPFGLGMGSSPVGELFHYCIS